MAGKTDGPAPVIPIDAAKSKRPLSGKVKKESEKKWGKAVMSHGFQIVPSMLLRGQARLGLDSRQLTIRDVSPENDGRSELE